MMNKYYIEIQVLLLIVGCSLVVFGLYILAIIIGFVVLSLKVLKIMKDMSDEDLRRVNWCRDVETNFFKKDILGQKGSGDDCSKD